MTREFIYINDVGPRDGLQNQAKILEPQQRMSLIQALADSGVDGIEVGAFVSPKAVPAMASTGEICRNLPNKAVQYSALIPNMRGFTLAQQTPIKLLSLVMASSNTMNVKNIGMDNEATLQTCKDVIAASQGSGIDMQVYLATAWECPFEGIIAHKAVLEYAQRLLEMGVSRIVIADTIGAASPDQVDSLMQALVKVCDPQLLACHFHDTRAMGLANVYAATRAGIRRFDASIAGLGGCPFAPGASGNVATEDVVMMCEQMGYDTGVDMKKLLAASDLATKLTESAHGGNAKPWLEKQYKRAK